MKSLKYKEYTRSFAWTIVISQSSLLEAFSVDIDMPTFAHQAKLTFSDLSYSIQFYVEIV